MKQQIIQADIGYTFDSVQLVVGCTHSVIPSHWHLQLSEVELEPLNDRFMAGNSYVNGISNTTLNPKP